MKIPVMLVDKRDLPVEENGVFFKWDFHTKKTTEWFEKMQGITLKQTMEGKGWNIYIYTIYENRSKQTNQFHYIHLSLPFQKKHLLSTRFVVVTVCQKKTGHCSFTCENLGMPHRYRECRLWHYLESRSSRRSQLSTAVGHPRATGSHAGYNDAQNRWCWDLRCRDSEFFFGGGKSVVVGVKRENGRNPGPGRCVACFCSRVSCISGGVGLLANGMIWGFRRPLETFIEELHYWKLVMESKSRRVWMNIFLFKGVICRFHVGFPGSKYNIKDRTNMDKPNILSQTPPSQLFGRLCEYMPGSCHLCVPK